MKDKFSIIIPILILSIVSFAIFSTILPENYVLIWFGIFSCVMIGLILYVNSLPNPAPEDFIPDGSEFKQPFRHPVD